VAPPLAPQNACSEGLKAVAIDGSFLRHVYEGKLLVLVGIDADGHYFLIAWGIGRPGGVQSARRVVS
jgi:hypothetical protein